MNEFPDFMKNTANAINTASQSKNVEGYVYEGSDGSQMAHWTCNSDGISEEHVHDFDEYFIILNGQYTLIIGSRRTVLKTGQEYFIEKGIPHSAEFVKGTRTIHAFGGRRVKR